MNKKFKIAALANLLVLTTAYATTILTPNQNNQNGQIPSGYNDLVFKLSDGNWTKNLFLPTQPEHNQIVTIESDATYVAYIDTLATDMPVDVLEIKKAQKYSFKYDANAQKWKVNLSEQFPNNGVSSFTVNIGNNPISKFSVEDGRWTGEVRFPNQADDGQWITVESRATYDTKIDTSNLLFNSNYKIKKGQTYWFKYNAELAKWVPEYIQPLVVNVSTSQISTPETAVTHLQFLPSSTVNQITLPSRANDRDRIVVTSTSTQAKKVNNSYLATQATLTVNQGDRYEFMYVADRNHWVLVSAPNKKYQASELTGGKLPAITTPVTRIEAGDGNYQPVINLPTQAQVDDKVVVKSQATWAFDVAATGLNYRVEKGDQVRFTYTSAGWKKETHTIDILLVNSPKVNQTFGENAAKIRLAESIDVTNETAENSGATFYIRPVGYINYQIPAADGLLNTALGNSRDDKTVQNERTRLKADGVLYQGTEGGEGCGWAYVQASKYNMTANQNVECGINVARHEFGHNLGVHHNDYEDGSNRGFHHPLGSTALGGNSLPFYASPNLYSPKYGMRLGAENSVDALKMINSYTATVAAYN